MTTRIMRDSVNPNAIPVAGAQLFAGYVNGSVSEWPASGWSKFPADARVQIDVLGTVFTADVLDVEKGNPTDSPGFPRTIAWVKGHKGSFLPVLYANRSTLTPMFNALNAAGLFVEKHFKIWIATLDGTKTVSDMTGVVAVQYAGSKQTGGDWDESIVYDETWKAPVVVSTPPPPPLVGCLVQVVSGSFTSKSVKSSDGGKTWQ